MRVRASAKQRDRLEKYCKKHHGLPIVDEEISEGKSQLSDSHKAMKSQFSSVGYSEKKLENARFKSINSTGSAKHMMFASNQGKPQYFMSREESKNDVNRVRNKANSDKNL